MINFNYSLAGLTLYNGVEMEWYVMRDLKRSNARFPAWKELGEAGFEVFTPMRWRVRIVAGRKIKERVAVVPDLLFVHAEKDTLDEIVNKTPTLQYRFVKGGTYCQAMVVREEDMNHFIRAVNSVDDPEYYLPDQITPQMIGKRIRVSGGALDGYEGHLLSIKGLRKKKLLIEIPGLIVSSIEVVPDFIQIMEDE